VLAASDLPSSTHAGWNIGHRFSRVRPTFFNLVACNASASASTACLNSAGVIPAFSSQRSRRSRWRVKGWRSSAACLI